MVIVYEVVVFGGIVCGNFIYIYCYDGCICFIGD